MQEQDRGDVKPTKDCESNDVNINFEEDLILDPSIQTGELSNGFKYYVRKNEQPKKRAELKLAIKIGSIFESENQRGIAHMIEHLAFRATKDSKKEFETVKELERHGVRFGAHQNAYTSFDETVYELHIPTDVEGLLEKSIKILRQLALEVRLSDEDVEKERSIVVEEWRQSRSGAQRAGEDYFKLVTKGCLYCDRMPIGLMNVINTVPPKLVRKFYHEHYHPSLMAIIIVGDFDNVDETISMIKSTFEECVKASGPPSRPAISFPEHSKPRVAVFQDFELTRSSMTLEFVRPLHPFVKVKHYRHMLLMQCFHLAFQNRLQKLALSSDPPFLNANCGAQEICAELASEIITVQAQKCQILSAIETVWKEIERARKFGFREREIEIVKSTLRSETKNCYMERDRTDSNIFASELKDFFLQGLPAPGAEYEYLVGMKLLNSISIQEINEYVEKYEYGNNCIVHVKMPRKNFLSRLFSPFSANGLQEHEIRKAIDNGRLQSDSLEEFEHHSADSVDLIKDLPPSGQVKTCKIVCGELMITELELSNGMKLTLKQTDFQDDEVLFTGWAHGGLTELAHDLTTFFSGKYSTIIAEELGIFGYPPTTILDLMSGKQVALDTDLSAYGRSVGGESSVEDFEVVLQLLHLLFVADIKYDEERLMVIKSFMREYLSLQDKNPNNRFSQMTDSLNTNNHYYFKHPNLELLSMVKFKKALQYYQNCFSNPAEFQVVFAGNISLDVAMPLFEKYLASIPVPPKVGKTYKKESVTPLTVQFPESRVEKTIMMTMVEAVCVTSMTFPVACGGKHCTKEQRLEDNIICEFVRTVLERRLLDTLRFELGSIYTVNVSITYSVSDPAVKDTDAIQGLLIVTLTCKPKDVSSIHAKILNDIKDLTDKGPTQEETKHAIEAHRRDRETAMRTNGYWSNMLSRTYSSPRYTGDIVATLKQTFAKTDQLYNTLTPEKLHEAFKRTFGDCSRMTISTLKGQPFSKQVIKWIAVAGSAVALAAGLSHILKIFRNSKRLW